MSAGEGGDVSSGSSGGDAGARADNRKLARRFYEEFWCEGNADAADERVAEDIKHEQFPACWPRGREGFKRLVHAPRRGFPDMHETILRLFADGDRVVGHFRLEGTHVGDFYGVVATGKRVSVEGIDLLRFEHGQIAEWIYFEDALSVFAQLGAEPPSEHGRLARKRRSSRR